MIFVKNHGVARAAGKYNKSRSYIYFRRSRYDGTIESPACRARRPHSHPNRHTGEEIRLLTNMCRRNPRPGRVEMWCRPRKRGYTRSFSGPYRIPPKLRLRPEPEKQVYKPKPSQQMTFPGERVQIDVKVVPTACKRITALNSPTARHTDKPIV